MRGIDTDNYDGVIPVSHFQKLHDDYGVMFNIIGLEAGMPYAQVQRENSNRAGIATPFAYKFLYWSDNDIERMKQAAGFGLPIAIDCEYGTGMPGGPDATVDHILAARDVLRAEGLYWGIYTGQWWWAPQTRNSREFAGDPLWHAAYPFGAGVLPPETFMPTGFGVTYGGWNEATVHQYADVCYGDELGAWHLDMNAWNPAKIGETMSEQPQPAPQPTEVEALRALVNAGAIIVAGNRNLADLSAADKSAIRWIAETAGS